MKSIPVLMCAPAMPMIMEGVGKAFTLHKLWEQPDEAAFLKANAGSIRAIAGGAKKRMDGEFLKQFPKLEFVSNFGVGYDGVDAAWCGKNGVLVSNTPDVLTDEVADLAMGLLISAVRQLPQADAFVRRGDWLKGNFPLTATLRGRTMGILALGRIGKAIAIRAEAFGIKVVYHGRSKQAGVNYPYYSDLTEMAKAVDILLSVAPGGDSTKHLINAAVLKALGPEGNPDQCGARLSRRRKCPGQGLERQDDPDGRHGCVRGRASCAAVPDRRPPYRSPASRRIRIASYATPHGAVGH